MAIYPRFSKRAVYSIAEIYVPQCRLLPETEIRFAAAIFLFPVEGDIAEHAFRQCGYDLWPLEFMF